MTFFRHNLLTMFRRRKVYELAEEELADAELALLKAQSGLEWARSQVDYRTAQCSRLRKFLIEGGRPVV